MKKEIILQEEDFNYLKENSDLWVNHKRDNTRFIKFNITLERRFLRAYSFKDFEMLIDGEVPESLKIHLERFKEDMIFGLNSSKTIQLEIDSLKAELDKVPSWIKSIFK